jgi:hypothetical protein
LLLALVLPVMIADQTNSIEEFQRMDQAQAVITEQQLLAEEELRKQEQKDKDLNETMAE